MLFHLGGRGGENQGGERSVRPSGSANSNNSARPASGGGTAASLNMDNYVRGLVRQYDKNGDMMLQADEQSKLSGKAATADLDKDGVITVDELVTTLSGNAPAATSTTGGGSDGERGDDLGDGERGRRGGFGDRRRGRDQGGGDSDQGRGGPGGTVATRVYTALAAGGNSANGAADKRRTYRFTRAVDRLPATGLPSWFKSRDANGDGQVAMSEYSRSWSDRTVNEFRRFDLNNDGIVTAKEAAGK